MASRLKRIRKSENYKYVSLFLTKDGVERWRADIPNGKCYETEKEAAKSVDLRLITEGKKPLNILTQTK